MIRLLSQEQICEQFNVSGMTVIRWVDSGQFPKPLMFGSRVMRWRQSDVEVFISRAAVNAGYSEAEAYGTRNGESGDGEGMGFPS